VQYGVYRFNPGTEAPDSVSVLLAQAPADPPVRNPKLCRNH